MLNKKMLLSLLVIGVVSVSAGAGTWAYFTDEEATTGNTFTAGTVDISLDEDGTPGDDVEFSAGFGNMKPGDVVSFTIDVTNIGTLPVNYSILAELDGDIIHIDSMDPTVTSVKVDSVETLSDSMTIGGADDSDEVVVEITFPIGADNTYQGQSGILNVTFSATQQGSLT